MDEWYSIGGIHDPMSCISHLVGLAVFFLLAFPVLNSARRSRTTFRYTLLYVLATLFLLTTSSIYHIMEVGTTARSIMLRLDIVAIFVMISSTFTAIHGILFSDWRKWAIIGLLWTITILGVTFRTLFFSSIPGYAGDTIFLLMGWIGAVSAFLLWREFHWRAIVPVLLGGVFYTVGALMNTFDWPILIDHIWGPHETFHLFVLAGLGAHWAFIWSIADGSFQRHAQQQRASKMEIPSEPPAASTLNHPSQLTSNAIERTN